jgi:hypothetical protein
MRPYNFRLVRDRSDLIDRAAKGECRTPPPRGPGCAGFRRAHPRCAWPPPPRALLDQTLFGRAAHYQPRAILARTNGDCHDRRIQVPEPHGDQANDFHGRVLAARLGPDESALIRENFLSSPGGGVRCHADVEVEFKYVLAHAPGRQPGAVPSSEKAAQISDGAHQKLILVGNHWPHTPILPPDKGVRPAGGGLARRSRR